MKSSISMSISVTSSRSQPLLQGLESLNVNNMHHQPYMHLGFSSSFIKASPHKHTCVLCLLIPFFLQEECRLIQFTLGVGDPLRNIQKLDKATKIKRSLGVSRKKLGERNSPGKGKCQNLPLGSSRVPFHLLPLL